MSGETREWQPIETATRDPFLLVLIYRAGAKMAVGQFDPTGTDMWKTGPGPMDYFYKPTHWMPLPTPPHGEEG